MRASYSVFDFIARRWLISELELGRPLVMATRTSNGWDVTRLLKPRTGGPGGAPTVSIGTLRMYDARVVLARPAPELTTRIDDMDLVMGVSLDRGGFGLDVRHLSLQIGEPALRIGRVAGRVERRGLVVTLGGLRVDLPVSHVRVDGTVTSGGERAVLDLAVASGALAFREVGLFVPAVARIPLQPSFRARLTGPVDRLITDLDLQSRAGSARGRVTIVPGGERPGVEGTLALARVDPAPWSQTPAVAGSVTGQTTFANRLPAQRGAGRPAGAAPGFGAIHLRGARSRRRWLRGATGERPGRLQRGIGHYRPSVRACVWRRGDDQRPYRAGAGARARRAIRALGRGARHGPPAAPGERADP